MTPSGAFKVFYRVLVILTKALPLVGSLTLLCTSSTLALQAAHLSIASNSLLLRWQLALPGGAVLTLPVFLDVVSALFGASVTLVARAVFVFSRAYMAQEKFFVRFHLLVLSFVASMLLLIFSPNLISLLLG